MNKLIVLSSILIFTIFSQDLFAQPGRGAVRSAVKSSVKKEVRETHVEPQRDKGREAIKEVTYGDKDAVVPKSQRGNGTLTMEYRTYKKNGKLSEELFSLFELSTIGEVVTTDRVKKNKTNTSKVFMKYDDNAHYFINVEENTATKMPMRHMQKAMAKGLEGYTKNLDPKGTWTATGNSKNINGFNCKEYIYTEDETKKNVFWLATNIFSKPIFFHTYIPFPADLKTTDNINKAPFPANSTIIKAEFYEKDVKVSEFEIKSYSTKSDPKSFDISKYRIVDILDSL